MKGCMMNEVNVTEVGGKIERRCGIKLSASIL